MVSYSVFAALGLLCPREILNMRKRRIGNNADGGYVVFDDFEHIGPIYSYGVAQKIQFDFEMAQAGKQVYIMDVHSDAPHWSHKNFNFRKQSLEIETDHSRRVLNLADTIDELGHISRSDLFLKLDLEGAEWDLLWRLPFSELGQFRQIVLEVHDLDQLENDEFRTKFVDGLTRLNNQFVLGHVHANNHAPLSFVGGFITPQVAQLTYVRADLVKSDANDSIYPTRFDYPSNEGRPDHLLWFYPYLPASHGRNEGPYRESMEWATRGGGYYKPDVVKRQLMILISQHESQLGLLRAALNEVSGVIRPSFDQ